MKATRILTLVLVMSPGLLWGQKKEDFISLQRDVAQLQDQMKQLQRSQDEKLAALTALVQQAIDASAKASAGMAALDKSLTAKINEEQAKLVAPMAGINTKLDQLSDENRMTRENIADVTRRLIKLDSALADVNSAVRVITSPPPAPAPAAGSVPGVPTGMSAESLFQSARSDYSAGKDELAMQQFLDYLKYFPSTENAPSAQYYIGNIYDRAKQYDDAILAFQAVLDRFPENPRTPDAFYMRAVDLMKANRKAEATTEFRAFLKRYPSHENAPRAQAHLKTLGAAPAPARPASKKK